MPPPNPVIQSLTARLENKQKEVDSLAKRAQHLESQHGQKIQRLNQVINSRDSSIAQLKNELKKTKSGGQVTQNNKLQAEIDRWVSKYNDRDLACQRREAEIKKLEATTKSELERFQQKLEEQEEELEELEKLRAYRKDAAIKLAYHATIYKDLKEQHQMDQVEASNTLKDISGELKEMLKAQRDLLESDHGLNSSNESDGGVKLESWNISRSPRCSVNLASDSSGDDTKVEDLDVSEFDVKNYMNRYVPDVVVDHDSETSDIVLETDDTHLINSSNKNVESKSSRTFEIDPEIRESRGLDTYKLRVMGRVAEKLSAKLGEMELALDRIEAEAEQEAELDDLVDKVQKALIEDRERDALAAEATVEEVGAENDEK